MMTALTCEQLKQHTLIHVQKMRRIDSLEASSEKISSSKMELIDRFLCDQIRLLLPGKAVERQASVKINQQQKTKKTDVDDMPWLLRDSRDIGPDDSISVIIEPLGKALRPPESKESNTRRKPLADVTNRTVTLERQLPVDASLPVKPHDRNQDHQSKQKIQAAKKDRNLDNPFTEPSSSKEVKLKKTILSSTGNNDKRRLGMFNKGKRSVGKMQAFSEEQFFDEQHDLIRPQSPVTIIHEKTRNQHSNQDDNPNEENDGKSIGMDQLTLEEGNDSQFTPAHKGCHDIYEPLQTDEIKKIKYDEQKYAVGGDSVVSGPGVWKPYNRASQKLVDNPYHRANTDENFFYPRGVDPLEYRQKVKAWIDAPTDPGIDDDVPHDYAGSDIESGPIYWNIYDQPKQRPSSSHAIDVHLSDLYNCHGIRPPSPPPRPKSNRPNDRFLRPSRNLY